ncbi:MAG: sulfotransferase family protein [Roseobacter sp.]
MELRIIGPGFGRTGTKSMKMAIEQLGFGPCHHMYEVFDNPPQVAFWKDHAEGRPVDWRAAFAGYNSQIDWPGAHVWRELSETFPDAKVLLTMRPEDSWWRSYSRTIGKVMRVFDQLEMPPHIREMILTMEKMVEKGTFGGSSSDETRARAAYRQRRIDVEAAIPADRLLVFDVAQGWQPLCRFLDVPVPTTPFPHENKQDDFWAAFGGEPEDP